MGSGTTGTQKAAVRPSTAAPSRSRRGFYGLLAANALSLSGTRLSMIALPWFVVTSTGSALHTGLAAFAQMAPYVLAKALAGPVVDRLGPRAVIIGSELAAAAALGLIPVLHLLDLLPFGTLLVMVALVGLSSGPADGAKQALVPDVARRAQVPLERVTGLLGSIERLASTVGAAGAGAVVAVMGAVPALAVNVVTFVGAVVLIAVTIPRAEPAAEDEQDPGSYPARLRSGAVFIRHDPLLRSLYVMVAITNLLDAAMFSVILPVWAHQTGAGPGAVGLLAGALSGAALLASLLAAVIGDRMPRRLTYLVAFLIGGAPRFLVLALDLPISALVGVYLVSGFATGFLNPIIGAVIYSRIPRPLVGRVTALGSSLAWAGIPFGGLAGGALLAGAGLSPALVILGIVYFVTTTLPGLQPAWKQMDDREIGHDPTELDAADHEVADDSPAGGRGR